MSDAARELFEQFRDGGAPFLCQVVDEKWEENLFLEYKQAAKGKGPVEKEDRLSLAEAISGFANSEGGVLVWGVKDGRERGAPDLPDEPAPIAKLKHFLSDLQKFTPQIVNPQVVGVEHLALPEDSAEDVGYVITYVPKSEGQPHMAIANSDQYRYYCRSGSSFCKMEHFMVADRFGRRPQPKLAVFWRLQYGAGTTTDEARVRVVIGVRNVGLGIALYPAIRVYERAPLRMNPSGFGDGQHGLDRRPQSSTLGGARSTFFVGGGDHVIHPGTLLEVTEGFVEVFAAAKQHDDVKIRYELYCDGFQDVGQVVIPGQKVIEALYLGGADSDPDDEPSVAPLGESADC